MGARCTQAAGVRAGRVIKGRADTAPLHPAPPPPRLATPRPPGPGHSLSRWAAPAQSTPLPRPLPSRRKLRDPERGDSTVIQQRPPSSELPLRRRRIQVLLETQAPRLIPR